MRTIIIALSLALAGCGSWKPYAAAAFIYPIEDETDYWISPERTWQCKPPWFDAEVGVEHKRRVKIGLYHESTVLCGTINSKPEIYMNGVRISKEWGGWHEND